MYFQPTDHIKVVLLKNIHFHPHYVAKKAEFCARAHIWAYAFCP